jgi:hypothetical protein
MTWTERLQAAVKRGKFTARDMKLAGDWGTCAVGEAPRKVTGVEVVIPNYDPTEKYTAGPLDGALYDLGSAFMDAVEADQVGKAVDLNIQITARVRELRASR